MKIGCATFALALTLSSSAMAQLASVYDINLKDAEAGIPRAMATVGQLQSTKGSPAPYDLVAAYKWYSLATKCEPDTDRKQGYQQSANKIALEMTSAQVKTGDAGAAGWKGKCAPP